MLKEVQRLESAYRATMLHGTSMSDFAVRSMNIRDQREWVTRGIDGHGLVVSLQRVDVESALDSLAEVYAEASEPGWAGENSDPVHPLAFDMAQRFLNALPGDMPAPEVNADPDGEIAFDWDLGRDRLLAVSIGLSGRLSFIYRNRSVRMRDTLFFRDDQIPNELVSLYKNLKR